MESVNPSLEVTGQFEIVDVEASMARQSVFPLTPGLSGIPPTIPLLEAIA